MVTTATDQALCRVAETSGVSSATVLLEIHLPCRGRIDPGSAGLLLGLFAGSAVFWTAVVWFVVLVAG